MIIIIKMVRNPDIGQHIVQFKVKENGGKTSRESGVVKKLTTVISIYIT